MWYRPENRKQGTEAFRVSLGRARSASGLPRDDRRRSFPTGVPKHEWMPRVPASHHGTRVVVATGVPCVLSDITPSLFSAYAADGTRVAVPIGVSSVSPIVLGAIPFSTY